MISPINNQQMAQMPITHAHRASHKAQKPQTSEEANESAHERMAEVQSTKNNATQIQQSVNVSTGKTVDVKA